MNYRKNALDTLGKLVDPAVANTIEQRIFDYILFITHGAPVLYNNNTVECVYSAKLAFIVDYLKQRQKDGTSPVSITTIPPQALYPWSLYPDKWEAEKAKLESEDALAIESHTQNDMEASTPITTLFTCQRCKRNRCHVVERQMRSSDEPTSLFITCLNCNHRWRDH